MTKDTNRPAPACPAPLRGQPAFDIADYCRRMERYLGDQEGPARIFWQALSFAVTAHQDQRRKSGEAYISHPLQVALILAEELDVRDPEILAAAVLHDTIEDVPEITTVTIGELFGPNIEAIVEACTKITSFSGDRQNFYKLVHRKLFSGAAARLEVMLIKIADRLHNLRTLDSMPKHKRQKIAEETLDIYAPLAKVMGLYAIKRELYDLALTYKFPRQSQKVSLHIHKLGASEVIAEVKRNLLEKCREAWVTADIRIRPKGLWAYFDPEHKVLLKSIRHPMELEITTNDIQSCYRVLGLVDQNYPPIPRTIRDFIANPKSTGYQSLHVRANVKGQHILFKIKTPEMHTSSRAGLLRGWTSQGKCEAVALTREVREMFNLMGSDDATSYREMIAVSGRKEIYTYTPKGALMVLPKQSIVLDFAFKIHTDIGKRCVSALIGQERVGPEYVLRDGEQVSIVTQKEPVRFEPGIQALCQTPKARAELAKMFHNRRLSLALKVGRSIIHQELKRYGVPLDLLESPGMEDIRTYFRVGSLDELFQALGEGRLRLRELIFEIIQGLCADRPTLQPPTGSLNRIYLSTLDPACVKFSRCCNPVPTEKGLYALLSERGLSIHRKKCQTMASLGVQREDVVEVRWNLKGTRVRKPQTLLILAAPSRNRVLMMLSVAPDEMQITDIELLSRRSTARTSAWQVHFTIENLLGLKHLLQHLAKTGLTHEFILEH
ncbi:MAG TPA: bifunctional (p)ppGpp synthetase/guanosine-3',5'-bis(diphosphate) 3'-pyrophosphohydrolase [Desulfurivibrio alkaliphilus]|uniref:Bifunctional (P)ppGpp synthetase/guanosine-3',5'-bis(Diphosphate) 3'-pyrophosphohydrolase n=1 Tax=Desulfurivibrio alkaliphilus TaxID=427923 RepID=A0A7C2TID0_9BACT|nr:bifunctional (p)ppGpp synthetase/guanosine-3',5'-bis(diphosphate) 3'-pyrophosphohydrolase [Desulfurivibrio alkaliphilus]